MPVNIFFRDIFSPPPAIELVFISSSIEGVKMEYPEDTRKSVAKKDIPIVDISS